MAGNPEKSAENTSLTSAVAATLAELAVDPRDQATAHLAHLYARRIDTASIIAAAADRLLAAVRDAEDERLEEQVQALRSKLSELVALKDLGARLEAVLASLGATPAARARTGTPPVTTGGKLAMFRGGA